MRLISDDLTPFDWISEHIKFFVSEHKGGAPLKPTDFMDEGFPVIPKKAIQSGNKLVINKPTFCSSEFSTNNERSIIDNTFSVTTLRDLVPTGPTIGTVVNFYTDEKFILSQGVYGLKLNRKIDRNYFANLSNSHIYRKVMQRIMVGSTQVHIRTPEYLDVIIQLPPLQEQKKIAKILSIWDRAIEVTEKLISNSQQQKKSLMQQLLTGKKRLQSFNGEFKRFHFSNVANIDGNSLGKKTSDDFEFKYISLSDVGKGEIAKQLEVHVFKNAPSRARRILKSGDILLATVRPNLQGFAKVTDTHEGCIASTGFAVLSPKEGFCGDYLYHYLFSAHITGQINALVVGTNYPAINSSDVAGLLIYCPEYEEQKKIVSMLNSCDTTIFCLTKKLEYLRQEKKALMQQLLTGKRRVEIDKEAA